MTLTHGTEPRSPVFPPTRPNPHQIAAHGAANTAVVHFNDLLFTLNQQVVIDTGFAEFIFDDGNAAAMSIGQDAI